MIVLDTNVVSEAMKPEPEATVRAWLNDQAAETLYLSSVTLAELLFGIRALPAGRRKNMLERVAGAVQGNDQSLASAVMAVAVEVKVPTGDTRRMPIHSHSIINNK